MRMLKRILHIKESKQEQLDASFKKLEKEERKANKVKVKRAFTLRFYMMILSGAASVIGLALFVTYCITTNLVFGTPGIIMTIAGFLVFRYYWTREDSISVESISGLKKADTANSLNIYSDRVEFAEVPKPTGFPWKCIGLKGSYYVNIWDRVEKKLIPFILPDQQYCDPIVFAQRVLGLPAHRKIFERKPKLLQKLKTALLVLAIAIVWLLILTTTGS